MNKAFSKFKKRRKIFILKREKSKLHSPNTYFNLIINWFKKFNGLRINKIEDLILNLKIVWDFIIKKIHDLLIEIIYIFKLYKSFILLNYDEDRRELLRKFILSRLNQILNYWIKLIQKNKVSIINYVKLNINKNSEILALFFKQKWISTFKYKSKYLKTNINKKLYFSNIRKNSSYILYGLFVSRFNIRKFKMNFKFNKQKKFNLKSYILKDKDYIKIIKKRRLNLKYNHKTMKKKIITFLNKMYFNDKKKYSKKRIYKNKINFYFLIK